MAIAVARSSAGLRVPLVDAFDLGPRVWDQLLTRSGSDSPFLTLAWHRACAAAVAPHEVDGCQAVVLRSAGGEGGTGVSVRLLQDRLSGGPVTAAGVAFGGLGVPG